MTIDFAKYQGTGNDFVLIDDRTQDAPFPAHDQALIARLCHRRFGIGADGLILLQTDAQLDFRMVYFNADGAEGSLCGNGGRCTVRFAHDLGLFDSQTRFVAADGEHHALVDGAEVRLNMQDVVTAPNVVADGFFLDTGSPHVVTFVDDVATIDVVAEGRRIRHDAWFAPGGTNVNFVQVLDEQTLSVRTYERGVEDETYSCGTGVTAAALVAHQQRGLTGPPLRIQTLGGPLRVSFQARPGGARPGGSFTDIWLIGPAERVFTGRITL